MIVVQAFHPGDIDQSQRFAQWIKELGGCKGHKLLLIHDTRCEQTAVDQLRDLFAESFDSVELQDFTDHWNKWPESPCQVFQQAARYVEATNPQPWFFVEPDCVALRAGWLDEFAAEYERAGKSFLGDFVSVHTPQLDVPDHMSGNAIYPGRMSERAGLALIAHDIAFDVAAAQQILPQMHHSELLHHSWKCPGFADWSQFEREVLAFKPKCALFHADKTGSLYPLLRARMNLSGDTGATNKASAPTGSVSQCSGVAGDLILAGGSSTPPAQSLTCDIFIKTYPPDFVWLRYCLRSIAKFAHGFNRVVVVTPEPLPQDDPIWTLPQVFVVKEEAADGYLSQQLFKLNAHQFCQSDYILHTDSDTIFTEPVTPQISLKRTRASRTIRREPSGSSPHTPATNSPSRGASRLKRSLAKRSRTSSCAACLSSFRAGPMPASPSSATRNTANTWPATSCASRSASSRSSTRSEPGSTVITATRFTGLIPTLCRKASGRASWSISNGAGADGKKRSRRSGKGF
jgi:hypothetical protein